MERRHRLHLRLDGELLGARSMIEGLALRSFGAVREPQAEPALEEVLKRVTPDEARRGRQGRLPLGRRDGNDLATGRL